LLESSGRAGDGRTDVVTELIPGKLSVGNWQEAEHAKRRGEHVITVANDSPFEGGDQKFGLIDGPGNSVGLFWDAVEAVRLAVEQVRKPVFVHCVGGRSRSVAVCVGAYRQLKRINLCEAYDQVIMKHDKSRIHPHLSKLLTIHD